MLKHSRLRPNQHAKVTSKLFAAYQSVIFVPKQKRPQPQSGFILTAWNPHSKRCSAQVNRTAHLRLLKAITASKAAFFNLWGASRDMCYRELSIWVDVPLVPAKAWAIKFGQNGFYGIQGKSLYLYVMGYPPQYIGELKSRYCWQLTLPKSNQALI